MTDPNQPYRPYEESGQDAGQDRSYGSQPYGSDPYGQPGGYGDSGAQGYGQTEPYRPQQGYGQPYPSAAGDHPQGTLILIFGIAGFFVGVLGPVAWVMGSRALKEIRATGVHPSNEQMIVIGRILGIVVTVLMILGALIGVGAVILAATLAAGAQ